MMKKVKILLFILMIFMGKALHAQDLDARSPQPAPVAKQQKAAEKKKAKQQKKIDQSIAKAKKQHLKNQSKNTRKMMRKSHHTSKRWNEDKKGFFLTRWLKKKNH
jgi:hypothetical protein